MAAAAAAMTSSTARHPGDAVVNAAVHAPSDRPAAAADTAAKTCENFPHISIKPPPLKPVMVQSSLQRGEEFSSWWLVAMCHHPAAIGLPGCLSFTSNYHAIPTLSVFSPTTLRSLHALTTSLLSSRGHLPLQLKIQDIFTAGTPPGTVVIFARRFILLRSY